MLPAWHGINLHNIQIRLNHYVSEAGLFYNLFSRNGIRPDRSCADAIGQCFITLARKSSASWILEGDIKSCFDTISHTWLLENTLMDKIMLKKWLEAGYIEEGSLYATKEGISQGSIISPCLLVNVLSGLEAAVKAVVSPRDKANLCIYADDFIITGTDQDILEHKVKPAVQSFLAKRGLTLSETKNENHTYR